MSPRGWSAALVAAVLLGAAAVPSAAVGQQTPDQTIDAQTDPKDAAAALNSGCADDIANCTLADISVTNGYNAPEILGDVVYNCAPRAGRTRTPRHRSPTRAARRPVSPRACPSRCRAA